MAIFIQIFCILILSSNIACGEDFLSVRQAHDVLEYWKRPIPLQTPNPESRIPNPESCGECHKEQYKNWKDSLHSKAVGPGLLSQLDPHNDPETALSCYYCHAPMEEQMEIKKQSPATSHQSPVEGKEYVKNPYFDNKLKLTGVSCSVCHLRGGKVYGPPIKTDTRHQTPDTRHQTPDTRHQTPDTSNKRPHNFEVRDFFESAEFCAACHQLDEGYELNGKVLTNTYREWKESVYGEDNITCQNCHMPDRQHLWKGIHDPEMTGSGVHSEVIPHENGGRLIITNTAVGHFFPTYVTPLIIVKGFMLDKKGKTIPFSVKEVYIGRKVSLNLETEIFDTRIAPQKSFEFDYKPPHPPLEKGGRRGGFSDADKIVFEVWVHPDEFYNRFFKSMPITDDIKKAIDATEKSRYRLFRKEINIDDTNPPP